MKKDRKIKLAEYVCELSSRSMTHRKRSEYIVAANYFIQNSKSNSMSEYRKFAKNEAIAISSNENMKEGVLDFLDFCGVGFKKQHCEKKKNVLVRRKDIDELNREKIREFILWLKSERDYSDNTLGIYRNSLNDFFEYADELTQQSASAYIDTITDSGKYSASTIALRCTSLKKYGEFCKIPVKLKRIKISKTLFTDDIPSRDEYDRICEYFKEHESKSGEDYYLLVRVMATTGCRVSELGLITYDMIRSGECEIRGKGNKYRRFIFNREIQRLAAGKEGLIMNVTARGLNDSLKRAGARCGIDRKKMHPHAFRHFFAKMFLQKTKDVVELANILGHESVDTTRIYLQKSRKEQIEYFNKSVNW